jgi:tetratricopeptide (TPR) repeat protein
MPKKKKIDSAGSRSNRTYLIAIAIIAVICIVVAAGVFLFSNPAPATTQASSFQVAGALYCQSVDFANAKNYKEALQAADLALAQNVSSLTPLIQSNRAGILVELNQYDNAIAAADAAIAAPGNLTVLKSIAYYNKANALYALGRVTDARAAYANASALDPTHQNIPATFP